MRRAFTRIIGGRRIMADLSAMRKPYEGKPMLEEELSTRHPFKLFDQWFKEAKECSELSFEEVNAVSLCTATKEGRPSSRMVLLKAYDLEGNFTMFTNYAGRKAREMEENPHAALLIYWPKFNRQIRVEGTVVRCPPSVSDDYWVSRPAESRASAVSSPQSEVVPNRQYLIDRMEIAKTTDLTKRNDSWWGGFVVRATSIEFWQGQSNRLHDRILFSVGEGGDKEDKEGKEYSTVSEMEGWLMQRLAP